MKKKKLFVIVLFVLLNIIPFVFAYSSNSSNYWTNAALTGGSGNLSSSSYKTILTISQSVSGSTNSSSYIACIGINCLRVEQVQEPTPTPTPLPEQPSMGGRALIKKDFDMMPPFFNIELLPDQTKVEELIIRNTGNQQMKFSIDNFDLQDMVLLNINDFELNRFGDEQKIKIAFTGSKQGYFKGNLLIKSGNILKELPIIINVSKKPMFDIKVDVLTKRVEEKNHVKANITMINFGELPVDVYLNYSIKDKKGNIIKTKYETIAAPLNRVIQRELEAPDKAGEYKFYAIIKYKNETAESEDTFEVVEKLIEEPCKTYDMRYIIFVAVLIIIILILLVINRIAIAILFNIDKAGYILQRLRRVIKSI